MSSPARADGGSADEPGETGGRRSRQFTMPVERPRRRHLFFVGGMLAALALLGPSVVRHRLWAHDGTCRIEVSVSPADATVSLDGSKVADYSPAAITVPAGAYTLTVERDGYLRV